ncbi:MAG: hypothetical protein Q4P66_02090, partial [Actinomycetaceae bacterium]|nr:hypothetical protein [Actinomycetaceae bacterium]
MADKKMNDKPIRDPYRIGELPAEQALENISTGMITSLSGLTQRRLEDPWRRINEKASAVEQRLGEDRHHIRTTDAPSAQSGVTSSEGYIASASPSLYSNTASTDLPSPMHVRSSLTSETSAWVDQYRREQEMREIAERARRQAEDDLQRMKAQKKAQKEAEQRQREIELQRARQMHLEAQQVADSFAALEYGLTNNSQSGIPASNRVPLTSPATTQRGDSLHAAQTDPADLAALFARAEYGQDSGSTTKMEESKLSRGPEDAPVEQLRTENVDVSPMPPQQSEHDKRTSTSAIDLTSVPDIESHEELFEHYQRQVQAQLLEQARRQALARREEDARRLALLKQQQEQRRREEELKLRRQVEEQARKKAEELVRRQIEQRVRQQTEEQARRAAEEQARRAAVDQAR